MKISILFGIITQAFSQIIFSISSQPFNTQCINNKLSIFGLNMFIKGSVNGVNFNLPMGEIGLPIINMDWFVNGNAVNQLTVMQIFNVDNSMTSGNRWSFQLKDDQPNIGAGIITLGQCVKGTPQTITVSFSTTSFLVGAGFPSLNLPPASGVANIINNLDPRNINNGFTTTPTNTFLRTTTAPTTTKLSNIMFSISGQPMVLQCVNNKLSIFGFNMFVKGSVNNVPFNLPMAEIGLPTINMEWFVNGNIALLTLSSIFNVDNSSVVGNIWSFQLKDDQGNIGAGVIQLGSCVQGIVQKVTVKFSSTSFLVGSGAPTIVNNLAPQNRAN